MGAAALETLRDCPGSHRCGWRCFKLPVVSSPGLCKSSELFECESGVSVGRAWAGRQVGATLRFLGCSASVGGCRDAFLPPGLGAQWRVGGFWECLALPACLTLFCVLEWVPPCLAKSHCLSTQTPPPPGAQHQTFSGGSGPGALPNGQVPLSPLNSPHCAHSAERISKVSVPTQVIP